MAYTKKEYNKLVKLNMPADDAYIMGRIPQVKAQVNETIDKVKSILYWAEQSIDGLEDLKEELNKL